MNIDVDTHFTPREIFCDVPRELKDAPRLVVDHAGVERLWMTHLETFASFREAHHSLKIRIDSMREAGFDKAILLVANSTIPDYGISLETSTYLTRAWNNAVSGIMEKHDCFIGAAQVTHKDVNAAIEEADRAVRDLGFRAIEVHGSWESKNFESPEWWPFFEEVDKLRVPLWFHVPGFGGNRKFNPYVPGYEQLSRLPPSAGAYMVFLWQPQLVATGLIFAGLLDRFPALKIVLTECDTGWVPSFMNWLDMIQGIQSMRRNSNLPNYYSYNSPLDDVPLRKKPSQYIRDNFYFALTNAEGYEMELLPVLINKIKLEGNIMIESDYDHMEGSVDIVRRIRQLDTIDEGVKEKICGKNAADLLGIKWAPSAYVWT